MAKHNIDNLCWREVVWQRPYTQDQVHELLAHLAVLTPRGAVIFESRSHGGHVKHYIGADSRYISKIENTIKIHGDIRLYPSGAHLRTPVSYTHLDVYKRQLWNSLMLYRFVPKHRL